MTQLDLSHVKVDVDRRVSPRQWQHIFQQIAGTLRILQRVPTNVEVSDTKRGHHIRLIVVPPLPDATSLVAVQAAMGSDGFREALNLMRAWSGRTDDWNILFLTKTTANEGRRPITSIVRRSNTLSDKLSNHLAVSLGCERPLSVIDARQVNFDLPKDERPTSHLRVGGSRPT